MEIESEHPDAVAIEIPDQSNSPIRPRRKLVVWTVVVVAMAGIFHRLQREDPPLDYFKIVPEIHAISIAGDSPKDSWFPTGSLLDSDNAKTVSELNSDRELSRDSERDVVRFWQNAGSIPEGTTFYSRLEVLDRSGKPVLRYGGGGRGGPGDWECQEVDFPKGKAPEIVDLKSRFAADRKTTIASIKPGVTELPVKLPDGRRIVRIGGAADFGMPDFEAEVMYSYTENGVTTVSPGKASTPNTAFIQTDRPDLNNERVAIEFEPIWKFPYSAPGSSGSTGNDHSVMGTSVAEWSIRHWDADILQLERVDVTARPLRTAVYRNVALSPQDTPTDFYIAVEPDRWDVYPAFSASDFGSSWTKIKITLNWPESDWALRPSELKPGDQHRWKAFLKIDRQEFRLPEPPIPFVSCSFQVDIAKLTEGRFTHTNRPSRLLYVLRDVDVVHPDKPGKVFHLPEITSWTDPFPEMNGTPASKKSRITFEAAKKQIHEELLSTQKSSP